MSWSHCLIKETLKDFKASMITIKNINQKISFKALLEFHEEVLIYEDENPFFIIGKNLPIKIGDSLEINGYQAQADSFDYSDESFQIINLVINPIFKFGDKIQDLKSEKEYEIIRVYKHYYDVKSSKEEIVMIPLINQNLAKKIN